MEQRSAEEQLDVIQDLRQSRGWALVEERLQKDIERYRRELEHESVAESTAQVLRGKIAAARTCLTIPEIIEGEARRSIAVEAKRK